MSSYLVVPKTLLPELERTCSNVREHFLNNPKQVNLDPLEQLINKIKEDRLGQKTSWWDTTAATRTFTAFKFGSYAAIATTLVTNTIQFVTSINNSTNCIRTLTNEKCFQDIPTRIDFCQDDVTVQYLVYIGGLVATVVLTSFSCLENSRNRHADAEKEQLNEIRNAKHEELFGQFLETLKELKTNHNKTQFDKCIKQVEQLKDKSNPYLPKLGSTESVVSSLLELVEDKHLHDTLEQAVKLAQSKNEPPKSKRRKKREHGESASPDNISPTTFAQTWEKIQAIVPFHLAYLRVGKVYITSTGKLQDSENKVLTPLLLDVRGSEDAV